MKLEVEVKRHESTQHSQYRNRMMRCGRGSSRGGSCNDGEGEMATKSRLWSQSRLAIDLAGC